MVFTFKAIVTIIITAVMQICSINMVSSTPTEATNDFLEALSKQDPKVMEKYMDNDYVNFLCNTEGDSKTINRMNDALFKNFTYEVEKVKQKDGVAAARVTIKSCDFSKVMDAYDKASYDYVMDNLYKEEIGDKDALKAKCLEIYVSEVEKAADTDAVVETVVFIPMVDDGYYGWNVIMTDELMKSVLGNLEMPAQN